MFDIIFRLIVNAYSEDNRSSHGELTDVIKYAAVAFAELTDQVRTTEDASPNFAYLVLRNGQ